MSDFKFGTVTVPDGKAGPWEISTFTITDDDVMLYNLRHTINGNPEMVVKAGTYKRLTHDERGVVMSNTPMEIRTAVECFNKATGRVLVNGLGLGMVLEGLLSKPDVTLVRVIEIDPDVIALHGNRYANDSRVEIICADAYKYKPAAGEEYDFVWHDIWDDISSRNLPLMAKLKRKYARRCNSQAAWSQPMAKRQARRERSAHW